MKNVNLTGVFHAVENLMKTVIVVGPQGSGKSRLAAQILAHLNMQQRPLVDEWNPRAQFVTSGALHLSHSTAAEARAALKQHFPKARIVEGRVLGFAYVATSA